MTIRVLLVSSVVLSAACGGSLAATTAPEPNATPAQVAATLDPHTEARTRFQNPGGMWMPRQMPEHADTLASLGVALPAASLSDPTQAPLSAVVSLGGCTASFVSPEGLVVTNHHCVQGALQLNSTPENNLVENGFLAASRDKELPAGPAQRIYVAQKISDVTAAVRHELEAITDGLQRFNEIEKRQKDLVAACEKDRPGIKCQVSSFFKGSEFQLTEYLEIRDVRLVYAPHRRIGNYGGEIDNWAWPRHSGDYSFYRAYVGKDGLPADHAPENVPFHPRSHLTIPAQGVAPGDFVFVAGYPGATHRIQTAAEMTHAATWMHPRYIEKAHKKMALLAELEKQGGETAIKAGVTRQGVQNGLEKYQGILDGLKNSDMLQSKQAEEQAFSEWAAAEKTREQYLAALSAVRSKLAEVWAADAKDEAFHDVVASSQLLSQAIFIARWVEEQQKPDAQRKPGYQQRDESRVLGTQKSFAKRFDRNVDRAFLRYMLQRAAALPAADRAFLVPMLGAQRSTTLDDAQIDKALDQLYQNSTLEQEAVRLTLLKSTPKALARSKDPFIKLALQLTPTVKQLEQRDERYMGELASLSPTYVQGLLMFKGGMMAPDANSTLRISYGTVRGYQNAKGVTYEPFTTATQIPGKNTGESPFDAPKKLLEAIAKKEWGPYAPAALGVVPVDFLADLDITGGNSGSPVMNGKGELVGLAFDGNYEGLASDVVFRGENTRTIACDIRYVLWVMDAVDGADALLRELGVEPVL